LTVRTLHVAALPFPTPQGTQALLHAMLSALGAHGHETHLLCYGHGGAQADAPYTLHRAPARSWTGSLRSGPSLEKLWLDARLAQHLQVLWRRLRPDALIAHHVEAASCAALLGCGPTLFVAHTAMGEELPTYFPPWLAAPLRAAGSRLDRWLVRRSGAACAVSPLLAASLRELSGAPVAALPLPWPLPAPIDVEERTSARRALQLASDADVALYAGNLDAYQGLDVLLAALPQAIALRPRLRWLIATASAHEDFAKRLRRAGLLPHVSFARIDSEPARRCVHAAADLALVPRRSAGGAPIKLLDACARALPVVAAQRALAAQSLAPHCELVESDDAASWCAAIVRTLQEPDAARERARAARAHVAARYTSARFTSALAEQVAALRADAESMAAAAPGTGSRRDA
jgi:glycosyltransferase involved in cell wall biosynthesis